MQVIQVIKDKHLPMLEKAINECPLIFGGKRKNPNYYLKTGSGFDIETSTKFYTDNKEREKKGIGFSWIYHWQLSIGDYVFLGREVSQMQCFFQSVENLLEKRSEREGKKVDILIWDANLGYEWQFCKHYWQSIGFDTEKFFCKEIRNPLRVGIGKHIELRECLGLFGNSLNQIAKDYCKTQKLVGDLDYSKVRTPETKLSDKEKMYCINDVVILRELGDKVFTMYYGKKSPAPFTSTGIVRNKVKRNFGMNLKKESERIQENLPDHETYIKMRLYLFKGGWCGTNIMYAGQKLKNVRCADYTSDYPAQMEQHLFPDGKITEIPVEKFLTEDKPYIAVVRFKYFKSTTSHSLIGSAKALNCKDLTKNPHNIIDNGRIFYAKEVILFINDVEIEGIAKAYKWVKMEILQAWEFPCYKEIPWQLLSAMETGYINKALLKKSGKSDTIEYVISKILVNCTFGMCATAVFPDEKTLNPLTTEVTETPNAKTWDECIKGMFLNPFIAFWVTSYARNLLIDIVTKYPDSIVQYDTDSIYFIDDDSTDILNYINMYNEKTKELNRKIIGERAERNAKYNREGVTPETLHIFEDLGCWDLDPKLKNFKGLGAKRYIKETDKGEIKVVVAGCRKYIDDNGKWRSTILDEMADVGEKDPFEFFSDGMHISSKNSKKLATFYSEYACTDYVKDYRGKLAMIDTMSSAVLYPIEFNMGLSSVYSDYIETLKNIRINGGNLNVRAFKKGVSST